VNCTSFYRTFFNCYNLTINDQIFGPSLSTRFLNQSVDFSECFALLNPFIGTQGTAPDIWSANYGTGTPITTGCFSGHSLASLSNYASIPAPWL
jgi:hypothetical protein